MLHTFYRAKVEHGLPVVGVEVVSSDNKFAIPQDILHLSSA
jgi:hypothetical protein